ncbi:gliding motility protein GldB-related protein, partial [Prevotella sp.]|uniref:gliding motility protein GldB-related protein n=1 Tax=Prevotella sp. TaxID=59823 RepID=UPI003077D724
MVSTACEFKLKQFGEEGQPTLVQVQRYDRLESRYLTTGDFSALQQMNIDYPKQTRMLIEDILQLGEVNDAGINTKLLNFYQDTILQTIIAETDMQYANMNDINTQLSDAFKKLQKICPEIKIPTIYTQISALNQSIVIGDNTIGISLDKYLGKDFEPYRRFYTEEQRQQMTREQ